MHVKCFRVGRIWHLEFKKIMDEKSHTDLIELPMELIVGCWLLAICKRDDVRRSRT